MREGSNKLPFFLKSKKELISLDNILQMQGIPLELRRALGSLGSLAIPFGTPVNAAAGTDVLTIDGAVIDGETVTIGADVYEFAADAKQTVTAGRIAVDITAKTTAAQGKLKMCIRDRRRLYGLEGQALQEEIDRIKTEQTAQGSTELPPITLPPAEEEK